MTTKKKVCKENPRILKDQIWVWKRLSYVSLPPTVVPFSKTGSTGAAAISRSGWMTSIPNTSFFCHRFNTRNIFPYNWINHVMNIHHIHMETLLWDCDEGSGCILLFNTLSSTGHSYRFWKVTEKFFKNLGPNTSLSVPNWWRDCLIIESTT